jgi:hypothetical protein
MRIARGLSGTLQLSSGELAVGAVVAVDLAREGVWPARVLGWASDLHCRVHYVLWDSWEPTGEPAAVVASSAVLPLPRRREGRAVAGDVGLLEQASPASATGTVYRLMKVVRVAEAGLHVRLLPRRSNATIEIARADEGSLRWAPPQFSPAQPVDTRFKCTPLPRLPVGNTPMPQLTTASQLAAWKENQLSCSLWSLRGV